MLCDKVISVHQLSKCFHIYESPADRLKQLIYPKIRRSLKFTPKQYFSEFWALSQISFSVRKGETIGIIGRNGSGKSTLLQLICGTLTPSGGEIKVKGRIAALLELGSGFNPEYTGLENIYMNAAILGLTKEETSSRLENITKFADIGEFLHQPVRTYSSGMMVRLAFSVAINVDADVIIIDEALAVGDELFQRKCFSRLEALRERGATIVFVSHSGTQIVELCSRAIFLDRGELLACGDPKTIIGVYQKLLYAPAHTQEAIRIAIKKMMNFNPDGGNDENLDNVSNLINEQIEISPAIEDNENFDPHLVPENTIVYESKGANIDIPVILNKAGVRVNGLIRGNEYKFCYQVKFTEAACNVRFGMSIKSISGMPLGGAFSAANLASSIPIVAKGSSLFVEFSFFCNINPGTYFLNAGVFGVIDGEETFLHRKVDVTAFRVLPIPNNIETEIVSLGFSAKVNF